MILVLFLILAVLTVLIAVMPKLQVHAVRRFSEKLGLEQLRAEKVRVEQETCAAQAQLDEVGAVHRGLRKLNQSYVDRVAQTRAALEAPPSEDIELVYELGELRPGAGYVQFVARRQGSLARIPGTGRIPDPKVWKLPRLVRVFGQNESLARTTAEGRFGSVRDFELSEAGSFNSKGVRI